MCLGLAHTLGGFLYPLEMETREGTVWLHVLAMKTGINLYDHSKVAFVNMNHGPLEPILKTLVAFLFSDLRGWSLRLSSNSTVTVPSLFSEFEVTLRTL